MNCVLQRFIWLLIQVTTYREDTVMVKSQNSKHLNGLWVNITKIYEDTIRNEYRVV